MYSKNDIRHYFGPVHLMTMPRFPGSPGFTAGEQQQQHQPHYEASLPTNFFPERSHQQQSQQQPQLLYPQHNRDLLRKIFSCPHSATAITSAVSHLVPSQIKATKSCTIKSATSPLFASRFNCDPVPFDSLESSKSPESLESSQSPESSESLDSLDDRTVADSDENYSVIGFGHSFAIFTAKPEEEINFESPDPVDSALVALLYHALMPSTPVSDLKPHLILENSVPRIRSSFWQFYQPVHRVCFRCRKSSLRWAVALIYKLLLIAWDLWQYKTD